MKKILTLFTILMMAINMSALPEWPRKYATTVVRGHVNSFPKKEHTISVWGGVSDGNIKGEFMPDKYAIDSTGVFFVKWSMCWPQTQKFEVCGIEMRMLLYPGDTVDIDIDYPKAQELKDDTRRLYQEAIRISGLSLPHSPQYMALYNKLKDEASFVSTKELEQCRADFYAFREMRWKKHLKWKKEVKATKLKKTEKELLELMLEGKYITQLYFFKTLINLIGCDSTEIAAAKQQFTIVDPHARSLVFPKSMAGACYFNTGHLEYLKANNLDDLPLGRYLKERKRAEETVDRIKAFRQVSTEEIAGLSPEFQLPIHELEAEMAEKMKQDSNWQPTGEPGTWLAQIIDRHKGKIVYVDYWATWCGPCQKGIKEMETVKDKYEKLGVDFIYITDSSSSTDGYLNLKKKHSGDHFLFTNDEIKQMNIPGYSGSIPHYLIYGRDGRLIHTLSGWPGLENMTQELDKALAK